jgi:tetratricopeptide (TPR) repeat protein
MITKCNALAAVLISAAFFCSCESNTSKSKKICDGALSEYMAKDYKQALADYKKAVKLDSTNGNAFEGKGSAEYHLNNYDTALQDEFTALRLTPALKNVRNWIGLIKLEMGDFRGSIEYYNRSIERGGDVEKDYEGRGAAEYHLGDYDKAMQDETRAIQSDSTMENAYYWRAQIKEAMGDYKGAIDDHLLSLTKGANIGKDYEGLAADESNLNNNAKALEYINKAIAADTSLKNAYNWRGRIKQDMEDYTGSIADYTMSLKISVNKGKDYEGRAVSEYYLKDYSNALSDIDLAIQSDTTLKKAQAWKELIEKGMRHSR